MTSPAGPRLAVAAACAVLGLAPDALGLPAAFLVAGLAAGTAAALRPVRAPTAPRGLVAAGEAVIGVSVGAVLRPGALAAVLLGCGALGLLLAGPLGADPLSAYLATTPGGLSAVLATAQSTGVDLMLVFGLQSIRLLLTVAAAPVAARLVGE